jgi:amiloride-sensitive sodium channel
MAKESLINEFASESSLHGVNFVFNGNRRMATRVFWILSLAISLISFGYYAGNGYRKWLIEPDISTNMRRALVKEIPYPAITICTPLFGRSELVRMREYIDKLQPPDWRFEESYLNVTQRDQMAATFEACYADIFTGYISNLPRISRDNVRLIGETYLNVDEALTQCVKVAGNEKCGGYFNRVLTFRGFCYSFNMQGFSAIFNTDVISNDFRSYKRTTIKKSFDGRSKNFEKHFDDDNEVIQWTLDGGYTKDHEEGSAPMVAKKGDFITVASVLSKENLQNLCPAHGPVYSYFFHYPNEIMTPLHEHHRVKFGLVRYLKISAKSYKASDDLRIIDPAIRNCYFGDEKKLKFFKTYTKVQCEYECMIDYVIQKCGCVGFLMPRNSTTRLCTTSWEMDCYDKIPRNNWPVYDENDTKIEEPCGCLKNCNEIVYSVKVDSENVGKNNFTGVVLTFTFDDRVMEVYENFIAYKLQNCELW